jgi:hypothetical protein
MAKQNRWGRKIGRGAASWTLLVFLLWVTPPSRAQTEGGSIKPSDANVGTPGGTSTDLFVGLGSGFDRPGLLPRANYGIGIGHTFGFLKKDPVGDELTFAYTYENAGTHGFLHTDFGEDTESVGVMKNFALPKVKLVSGYTWIQGGITSYTGNANVRKPIRQQRLARSSRSSELSQLDLDSRKLQQGGYGALVFHLKRQLHLQLVSAPKILIV